ncbi:MAG TPA: CRTAC1 family protein [Verrucomicrobiae bacterium]|nr:CRTAC1 family protein [Verrucomicrobiae bacterium]
MNCFITPFTCHGCGRVAVLGLLLVSWLGCRPADPEPAARPLPSAGSSKASGGPQQPTNRLGQQLAARDAEVWRDEVTARACEGVFVQLADQLRRAPEPITVLEQLSFERIVAPRPEGKAVRLPFDVHEQHFSVTNRVTLVPEQWKKALEQFKHAGWNLRQFAWQHEQFNPVREARPASSRFRVELHGEQPAQTNRFILRGSFVVEWADLVSNQPPQIRQLVLTNLVLLERTGLPGFAQHALVAPEPERPDAQVNLHPLIVVDLNGDRHQDIVLPGVNKVLLNDGRAGLQPVDFIRPEDFYALQEAGVIADFNGDGFLDFLGVSERGPAARKLVLHAGNGALPFSGPPIAVWAGQSREWPRYQISAASVITAGDIDGDGDLDVFVAQYRPPYVRGNLPTPYYDANDGYPSYLLLNDGQGHFELAPPQPALDAKRLRRTLSASLVDLDNDGDLDLVTINDFSGVDLYYNDGHGRFTDESGRLSNRQLFGMGHAMADFDGDGALDLLAIGMDITAVRRLEALHLAAPEWPDRTRQRSAMAWGNRIYLAQAGRWTEPPWAQSIAQTGWSWGTSVFDFDNDGRPDIYIANGHISGESAADYDSFYWTRDIYLGGAQEDRTLQDYFEEVLGGLNTGRTSWHGYEHNVLFVDLGGNRYLDVAWLMGVAHESDGRAVVTADLNEDGRPDLLVTEAIWPGRPDLMRHRLLVHLNQLPSAGHWIGVRLWPSSSQGRLTPIGAKVSVRLPDRTLVKQIITGDSFQAQHPFVAHFGLGLTTNVSELKVIWPGGRTRIISNPALDRYHEVE